MGTWAIVTIHGIGPSKPGETVRPLFEQLVPHTTNLDSYDIRWLRSPQITSGTRATPVETLFATEESRRFPMCLRQANGKDWDVIFAEVYWADLSKTKNTWWHLLLRLVTLVFHLLPVVVTAGAYQNRNSWLLWRFAARLLHYAVWTVSFLLSGPLAALYLYTTALVLLYHFASISPLSSVDVRLSFTLLAVLSIGTAVWVWRIQSKEQTFGGSWFLVFNCLSLVAVAPMLAYGFRPHPTYSSRLLELEPFRPVAFEIETCLRLATGLLSLASAAMLLASGLGLILVLTAGRDRDDCRRADDSCKARDSRNAIAAQLGVSSLQLSLWSLLVPVTGIWLTAIVQGATTRLALIAANLFFRHAFLLILPAMIMCVVAWNKWRHAAEKPRLLVNTYALVALVVVTDIGAIIYLVEILNQRQLYFLDHAWVSYFCKASLLAVPLIGLLGRWSPLSTALHLLMDITNHFYRNNMRILPLVNLEYNDPNTIQKKITQRTACVLNEVKRLMAEEKGTKRLTIIAHSQGTITGVITLLRISNQSRAEKPWLGGLDAWLKTLNQVNFVTMGSPFTNLYQRYFPGRYPPLYVNGAWNKEKWGEWNDGARAMVDQWVNLYRGADYVGTTIDGNKSFPTDHQLGNDPAGRLHVGYWQSAEVVSVLQEKGCLPNLDS